MHKITFIVVSSLILLCACGGSHYVSTLAPPAPPTVSLAVSPNTVTLAGGEQRQLNATLAGASSSNLTWSVQEGAAGGTVDVNGKYTAPLTAGTYHVRVTCNDYPSVSAVATITVPPAVLHVSHSEIITAGGDSWQLTTWIEWLVDTRVSWAIEEGSNGGIVTQTGQYTAPSSLGTYHLVVTSIANPTLTGKVAVYVKDHGFSTLGETSGAFDGTATLLPGGNVLLAGGGVDPDFCYYPALQPYVYVAATGNFVKTEPWTDFRMGHTATLLPSGKVLIAGGAPDCGSANKTALVFDPATMTFVSTGAMTIGRTNHSADLLKNGTVLIAGGAQTKTVESYDPATGQFSASGSLSTIRWSHASALLADGKVLLIAGYDGNDALATSEIFDPATLTSTTFTAAPSYFGHSATTLPDGTILRAGGAYGTTVNDAVERFDPVTRTFIPAGKMTVARAEHTATLLDSGMVMFAGGFNRDRVLSSVELYDPATQVSTVIATLHFARNSHTATKLLDGRVLIEGGGAKNAEIY